MRLLTILLALVGALPVLAPIAAHADKNVGTGDVTVSSEIAAELATGAVRVGGDDTTVYPAPNLPEPKVSLEGAYRICKAAESPRATAVDREFCENARERTRIPWMCRRIDGKFGLPDVFVLGSLCH